MKYRTGAFEAAPKFRRIAGISLKNQFVTEAAFGMMKRRYP
jgi:hypothetical protein